MEYASKGNFCTNTPSPRGALCFKHDMTCSNMLKVNLSDIEVNEKEWEAIELYLKKEGYALQEYFSHVLHDISQQVQQQDHSR